MANIWVTGANGQLGMTLRRKSFSPLDELFFTDVEEVDITDRKAIYDFIEANDIDTIINCAGYTAVDRAEEQQEQAIAVNHKGVASLAIVSFQLGCLLIHISTDYVFDGMKEEPYTEKDKTNPQTVYGNTKREGERAILRSGCLFMIIRTSWLYSACGNNFVATIRRLAEERDQIQVVNDQWGSPTCAEDLADAIVQILQTEDILEYCGLYHYSNEGSCTWFDFAREILQLTGSKTVVEPITTEQFPTLARRPRYSVLDKTKIKKTFALEIPDWKESLRKLLSSESQ